MCSAPVFVSWEQVRVSPHDSFWGMSHPSQAGHPGLDHCLDLALQEYLSSILKSKLDTEMPQ